MHDEEGAALEVLRAHVGHKISRILRHHYEFHGAVDRDSGDVEIWFGDHVAWLSCAANGQDLRVRAESWTDPFAPPLSAENEKYVKESGRWIVFDVSNDLPYAQIVGHTLGEVTPVLDEFRHIIGVRLRIDGSTFEVWVDGDELFATVTNTAIGPLTPPLHS